MKILTLIFVIFISSCATFEDNIIIDDVKDTNKKPFVGKDNLSKIDIKTPIKTQNHNDLWQEISSNLTLNKYKSSDIFWHLKWFKDNPKYLTRVSKRAKNYLKIVLDEVKKQGLPYEIALLPIVESGFSPSAYSHGTASGMWQFIPSTGKLYGLKQNFWIDERRDIILSTKAAVAYLKSLHKFFKGDWYHAIAAYNSGPGRVKKAIEKNKKLGKPTDFWNLKLPAETKGYVPRLLAVAELIKNQKKYGQNLVAIEDKTALGEVLLASQLDLSLASKWSGLSIDKLYELNPALNRWATPNRRYHLILPIEKTYSFREKLKNYPKNKRIKWVRHKVKSGQSIISLAKKYKVSTGVIKEINKLKSNKIKIGDYLIIPIASQDMAYYSHSKGELDKKRLQKDSVKVVHIVGESDTLWSISRKYLVSVKKLIKWNKLKSKTIIHKGDKIVILQRKSKKNSNLSKQIETKNATQKTISYTIRSGDNLSKIAKKFSTSVGKISTTNNLNPKKPLKIGKKLKILIDIIKTYE